MKAFRDWWTVDMSSSMPVVGSSAALDACARYVRRIVAQGDALPGGGAPVIIGETGVPFDLGGGGLFGASRAVQLRALERTMRCLESSLACFTLWNYTPSCTLAHGDG